MLCCFNVFNCETIIATDASAITRSIKVVFAIVKLSVCLSVTKLSCAKRLEIALWSLCEANRKPIVQI